LAVVALGLTLDRQHKEVTLYLALSQVLAADMEVDTLV
jgi:hypothetical protein